MVGMSNSCQIYDLAKKAKERLKRNNYSIPKPLQTPCAKTFSDYIKTRHNNIKVSSTQKQTPKSEDEMYLKVCDLISKGKTQNPVLSLIDKDFFDNLDSEAKQFYIANLTQKFKFLVKRYYREHC